MTAADGLRALIPTTKKEAEKLAKAKGSKEMSELKALDKGRSFDSTKVRETVKCISCFAIRAVFSQYAIGTEGKPAPTAADLEKLQRSLEADA